MTTAAAPTLAVILPKAGDLYLYQVNKYLQFAALTCSILEIISTLPDEISLIWPARRSFMKVIFLVNKYSPLLDFIFIVLVDMIAREPHMCAIYFQALTYSYFIGTLISEVILILRTHALWAFDKHLTCSTLFISSMMVPHSAYTLYDMLRSNRFLTDQNVTRAVGCMPNINDQDAWPAYTYLICSETMVVILTVLKRYVDPAITESSFASVVLPTMYRDGTCFWAAVLAFSVVNFLMMFFAPRELSYSMQMPLRVVHSALCTRVLLNLREAAAQASSAHHADFTVQTTLAFEHPAFTDMESREDGRPLSSYALTELGHHG
ncbi:hypothetical protein BD310DRAFT_886248 [Dichomitus squalens]|uniref:DUF6533 domain-containing protein n=1 Tax=Dichomitus squalens TaxID=114155 RepID=A0A4V2K721_9APHY|nr:hypothetical protein BD310DRAFT_886248 [Dichomitus squalens]